MSGSVGAVGSAAAAPLEEERWEDAMEAYGLEDEVGGAGTGWAARRREAAAGRRLRIQEEDEGVVAEADVDGAAESFGAAVARERGRRARRESERAERVAKAARREAEALDALQDVLLVPLGGQGERGRRPRAQ